MYAADQKQACYSHAHMSDRFPLQGESMEPREEVVIDALRRIRSEDGDPSSCAELQAFRAAREAEANEKDTDRANLETAIRMATIYARAGYAEAAYEELDATRQAAGQRDEFDLVKRIDDLMDRLERFLSEDQS